MPLRTSFIPVFEPLFEYKKCDKNRHKFPSLEYLENGMYYVLKSKLKKAYEFYLHYLHDAIKKIIKKLI